MMDGKNALIMGIANQRSIAWAVAKKLYDQGANLVLTYQSDRFKGNLDRLVSTLEPREGQSVYLATCDVTKQKDLENLRNLIEEKCSSLDALFHSIAYAPQEALTGRYLDTTWEAFQMTLQISCYSFVALVKALEDHLREGCSIATMTYLGSVRAVPGYNVMGVAKAALEASVRYLAYELGEKGIRVNGVSAGPVRTLAAAGIPGFSKMLENYKSKNMAKKALLSDDVAEVAAFILGPASRAITGEIVYVDYGYHSMGL
ncbi:MAG: enoyl-ACP reductase [Planctomycetota bacterium]|nr:MAG: enoyl-ACP reductase [Planctomycetota bacterium]